MSRTQLAVGESVPFTIAAGHFPEAMGYDDSSGLLRVHRMYYLTRKRLVLHQGSSCLASSLNARRRNLTSLFSGITPSPLLRSSSFPFGSSPPSTRVPRSPSSLPLPLLISTPRSLASLLPLSSLSTYTQTTTPSATPTITPARIARITAVSRLYPAPVTAAT